MGTKGNISELVYHLVSPTLIKLLFVPIENMLDQLDKREKTQKESRVPISKKGRKKWFFRENFKVATDPLDLWMMGGWEQGKFTYPSPNAPFNSIPISFEPKLRAQS